jgi:putative ABC transport system permease protein
MEIGKISNKYPIGFTNTDYSTLVIIGFVSNEVYDHLSDVIKSNETTNSTMYIQSSNPEKLTKEVQSLIDKENITANVQNVDEMVKQINNVVLAISIFLYGFIILVSLITVTNVINTITTSIYLRRREFAMLKAVGMTDKSFNKMIRFESLLYGVKALIYGLPFGIILDYLLYKNVSSMFIYDYRLPYNSIIICVIFVSLIISITMIYAVRKIKNDNIVDVIKQENI